jgi:hypothetical protein
MICTGLTRDLSGNEFYLEDGLMNGRDERPTLWEDDDDSSRADHTTLGETGPRLNAPQDTVQASPGPDARVDQMPTGVTQLTKIALDFVTEIFGENWAERAASRLSHLRSSLVQIESLEQDLAVANSQFKEKDKEFRLLRASHQSRLDELDRERTDLDSHCSELRERIEQIRADNAVLQEKMKHATAISKDELFSKLDGTFGAGSGLCSFIRSLDTGTALKIGYACLYTLPSPNAHLKGESQSAPSWHAMVTLGNKFLEVVEHFDGPERGKLLHLAAEHLSRTSQMFTFSDEEGQVFHSDRHALKTDRAPSAGARVRRVRSFLVTNNKTKQILQKADVDV